MAGDLAERLGDGPLALDAGGIARRPHEDEIVVHDLPPVRAEAVGHELLLRGRVVNQHDVGVALPAQLEGLAGAHGHDFHLNASLLAEQRHQHVEEAAVLGAAGRCQGDGRSNRLLHCDACHCGEGS